VAPGQPGPATAAGVVGGALQLGVAAAELKRWPARDVARILSELGRDKQAQVTAMASPSAAAEALGQLAPHQRDALLAELSEADRARLLALLQQDEAS
jgi:Mg/Co/Ni transporter MgtE